MNLPQLVGQRVDGCVGAGDDPLGDGLLQQQPVAFLIGLASLQLDLGT